MQLPLDEPPRDAQGEVQPHDHPQILNDDRIIRRISPHFIVPDDKHPSGKRISSMAYEPSTGANGGMSVDIESSITDAGLDPVRFVSQPPFIGAVRFLVGGVRSLGFQVGYHPVPGNDHHGEVWGNFTSGSKKRLAGIAEVFIEPRLNEENLGGGNPE